MDWDELNLNQVIRFQDEVLARQRADLGRHQRRHAAHVRRSERLRLHVDLDYDEAADTFTDTETGEVYVDDGEGNFAPRTARP